MYEGGVAGNRYRPQHFQSGWVAPGPQPINLTKYSNFMIILPLFPTTTAILLIIKTVFQNRTFTRHSKAHPQTPISSLNLLE